MTNIFKKIVLAMGYVVSALFIAIVIIVCSHQGVHYFQYDIQQLLPNWASMLLGVLVLVVVVLIISRLSIRNKFNKVINKRNMMVASLVVFLVQVFLLWNYYIKTGWDVAILLDSAENLASTGAVGEWIAYFSAHPNNMFLTVCIAVFIKIFSAIGLSGHWYFGLICLICLLSQVTSYLVYKITKFLTDSEWASLFAWGLFNILVGLSPWLSIPYSDTISLIFPILILYLYLKDGTPKYGYLKWFLIGFLSYVGYSIKPQTAIVLIAIVITGAINTISQLLKGINTKTIALVVVKTVILLTGCFLSMVIVALTTTPIKNDANYDDNKSYSLAHYVMLGMNSECQGQYCREADNYSGSFDNSDDRFAANIAKTKEEISHMGWYGFWELMYNKALANYTDGTFGWAKEGGSWIVHEPEVFFNENIIDRGTYLSDVLHRIYISNGKDSFQVFMQLIWFSIILISVFITIGVRRIIKRTDYMTGCNKDSSKNSYITCKRAAVIMVILLSVIGIIIFEQIFEARARYLFVYVSFFIIIASISAWGMLDLASGKIAIKKKRNGVV